MGLPRTRASSRAIVLAISRSPRWIAPSRSRTGRCGRGPIMRTYVRTKVPSQERHTLAWMLALATSLAPRRRRIALATVPLALLAGTPALARLATNGLAYSSASARVIQRQPARGTCHTRGSGLYSRPDPRCTPGALNPAVTQPTVGTTICRRGWTRTVRPDVSITEPEKPASMRAYGGRPPASRFGYDHPLPL